MITLDEAYFIAGVMDDHPMGDFDRFASCDYSPAQLQAKGQIYNSYLDSVAQIPVESCELLARKARAEWLYRHLGGTL